MNTAQFVTDDTQTPAVLVGKYLRDARRQRGWTISEMATKLGRQREWLNRVELGYSEFGEYKPASQSDLKTMTDFLGGSIAISEEELLSLGQAAEQNFATLRNRTARSKRTALGKLTHTEVIIGEKQIVQAITGLVNEQHSDAIIRNTGIKTQGSYHHLTSEWRAYREALGDFLTNNPNAIFKRIEYTSTPEQLEKAKEADARVAGGRKLSEVHNARIKYHSVNPLQLHIIIGQREAILALPQSSGQAGSNIAILVHDKIFVEALRVWYDEVLWNAPGDCKPIDFQKFDESFAAIKDMYKF